MAFRLNFKFKHLLVITDCEKNIAKCKLQIKLANILRF